MKGRLFGWGTPNKTERINSYECKVFECNNFGLVTKMRTEHLSEKDKAKTRFEPNAKLERVFYSFAGTETSESDPALTAVKSELTNYILFFPVLKVYAP